jgi:aldose 1-epimerase
MLTGQQSTTGNYPAVAEQAKLFTIENKAGTKLIVSNYGAAVLSLYVKDRYGKLADIVLGYDDIKEYAADEYYIGTVVGRYANRIAGETVFINGSNYKLPVKEGGYHLHGGQAGFNKKIFAAAPFQQHNKRGVIFTYSSPHLEEGFPGELVLQVIYTLDDDNAWTVEYKAVSNRDTLINLTQHTYFNLSGNLQSPVDGHELKILSHWYLPVNDMQVPTGEIKEVDNTVFDFTSFKKIGKEIEADDVQLKLSSGYDHSFVLEKQHTAHLKHAAVVKEYMSGRKMDVYTTEPAIHFYSGNFLSDIKGKADIVYNERSGLCLETQHFPDAPNHPHFPSTVLPAGADFYSKTVFKFSVE